ncbi:MAG: hypothetical protein ACRCVJ_11060 [Clostridium sp.]|uniref:hypothetical protein n=1 Tax=Clostridium sp. TaxID=1506 RepID=UPI003F30E542
MAKYTIELRTLVEDPGFKLFDFEYDFYTDIIPIIENFEKKFIQTYFFNEINCETVARWKYMVKSKLDNILPYYKQLYESELRAKEIDFLLNKDYTETFEKELDVTNSTTDKVNSTNSNENISNMESTNKDSNISNGISEVGLNNNSLTGINKNDTTTKDNNTSNASGTSNRNDIGKQIEKWTQTGKGNIGITSAGDLLEKWRATMINIDKMIIDECRDLFMIIY